MIDTMMPLYKRYSVDCRYAEVLPMARKDERSMVHLAVERDLQQRVSDFRFANRIPTKTAAWQWLVRAALDAGLTPTAEDVEAMSRG